MTDKNIKDLESKIAAAKNASKINPQQTKTAQSGGKYDENSNVGLRAGMEFVVSIIGGALIGLAIDNYFNTKPIFLIALFILGVITGFVNIWRVTEGHGSAIGFKDLQKDSKKGEDET
jgi:F0F1-type ATP synthase assembly protein I